MDGMSVFSLSKPGNPTPTK